MYNIVYTKCNTAINGSLDKHPHPASPRVQDKPEAEVGKMEICDNVNQLGCKNLKVGVEI